MDNDNHSTLLEKALAVKVKPRQRGFLPSFDLREAAELSVAYLTDRITVSQYIVIRGGKAQNAAQKAFADLHRAVREGVVQIRLIDKTE